MKKIILTFVCVTFAFSCAKKEEVNKITSEKEKSENKVIARAFGFSSIEENQDVSTIKFVQENNNLSKRGYKIVSNGENKKVVYAIPFKDNSNKFLLTDGIDKEVILDVDVDKEGNGDVTLITENLKTVKSFEKTQLIQITKFKRVESSESGRVLDLKDDWHIITDPSFSSKPFRGCFDDAYNSVCDDFIGCVAWYTHVLVPVTAAVYCLF